MLSAMEMASSVSGVRVSPLARNAISAVSAGSTSGAPSNTMRRYVAPDAATPPAGSMSANSGRAANRPASAKPTPIANEAVTAFRTATPARWRSPAPRSWLTYA